MTRSTTKLREGISSSHASGTRLGGGRLSAIGLQGCRKGRDAQPHAHHEVGQGTKRKRQSEQDKKLGSPTDATPSRFGLERQHHKQQAVHPQRCGGQPMSPAELHQQVVDVTAVRGEGRLSIEHTQGEDASKHMAATGRTTPGRFATSGVWTTLTAMT